MADVEVHPGSIEEPESLRQAMADATHVIHCAGATRAVRAQDFYRINQGGTRNVVDAVNAQGGCIKRLVQLSSLAAAGPAVPEHPALETDPPRPVSEYGKSKLAGELEVQNHCQAEQVILRPPAVYGPRDGEFLRLFRAITNHFLPKPTARQSLSLVFVKDLAEAVVTCLLHPAAAGKTYYVAAREVVNARLIATEIASQMGGWTVSLPLPTAFFWPLCLAQEVMSRLTGVANVLSLQKFAELRAPGWVCASTRLERDTGCVCPTTLRLGIAQTLAWYQQNRWL